MNREDNLKKINAELEMMSDEELENVVGGSCYETADDSRFLNVLLQGTKYHHCDRYGAWRVFWNAGGKVVDDIGKLWNSLGISVHFYDNLSNNTNKYFLNGREISRAEAWAYAENKVGKHLTKAQWDW